VGEDGVIQVRAPALTSGQRVKVIIETASEGSDATETSEETKTEKRQVIDIIADLPGQRLFKTAEEVDAYIREERDSWDR
jgi:hypothetical protein